MLHTIGGDDTNTQAGQLSFHLAKKGYELQVIGLPKVSAGLRCFIKAPLAKAASHKLLSPPLPPPPYTPTDR